MNAIEIIEKEQSMQFEKRKNDMFDLLDKSTKKQVKYIADKLRFMFDNDNIGKLSAELQVFSLVSNSALTLNALQTQVLRNGAKAALKGLTIEKYFELVKEEAKVSNEVSLTGKETAAMNEFAANFDK